MHRAMRMAWVAGLLLALTLAGTASAQRVEGDRASAQGPYQAEVTVRTQGEGERNTGFRPCRPGSRDRATAPHLPRWR